MDSLFCYHLVLMFVAAISFCLLWIGFATPGWIALTVQEDFAESEYTVSSLNRSLFYDVFCPQELESCKTCVHNDYDACIREMAYPNYTDHLNWFQSIIDREAPDAENWIVWQVITTIVVVCCVLGLVLVFILVCCLLRTMTYRTVATTGFFIWLVAGLLVWVPVGMVAYLHVQVKNEVDVNIPHDATLHIPYSIVILAMGGFMAFITAMMLLWLTGVCGTKNDDASTESRSQILSERTKTRTVFHDGGYYGPYAYGYYPEYRTNYVYREAPPKTEASSVTEDEFYVVDYPGYNGFFDDQAGRRVYDNRRLIRGIRSDDVGSTAP